MLIAFLVILGVDLIVLVILAALLFGRRRWLKRQPGGFPGAIRVTSGHVDGLGPKWKRGYGRWVRDVLVWTKAPLMFQNELVPVDDFTGDHPARVGEVKRLGDDPVVLEFTSGGAKIEVAAKPEKHVLAAGPFDHAPASDNSRL